MTILSQFDACDVREITTPAQAANFKAIEETVSDAEFIRHFGNTYSEAVAQRLIRDIG